MRTKKTINIEIGANIQAARERAGYTQEELSEVLNITPNHMSAIERGRLAFPLNCCGGYAAFWE
jgi:DNA-binding XRE family transcriptional regulator